MRLEWDERARGNAKYYIATDAWQTEEIFDRSGEEASEEILSDIDQFLSPQVSVLEIGCGLGRMVKPLARRFRKVYGVDVSPQMIRQGTERLKGLQNVKLWVNNGRDLRPLPANQVELVVSYIVFQHIPDAEVIRSYIKEAYRVLKPGGIFKFQVYGRDDSQKVAEEEKKRVKTTWLGARFTQREISQITEAAGFRILSTYFGASVQYLWVVASKP
jgi:SAM-dependent methyltransferase